MAGFITSNSPMPPPGTPAYRAWVAAKSPGAQPAYGTQPGYKPKPLASGRASQLANTTEPDGTNALAAHIARDHVIAMQNFLIKKGYSIPPNEMGVRGPHTNAAVHAFHNRTPPGVHNATSARSVIVPGSKANEPLPNASVKGPSRVAAVTAAVKTGPGTPYKTPGNPHAVNPSIGKTPGGGAQAQQAGAFDPKAFAQAQANAQYDPAISALQTQIGQLTNAQPGLAKQINAWYAQAQAQEKQMLAEAQTSGSQGITDLMNSFGNTAQLFGASNASEMQTPAQNASGELAGINQAQQDYLSNMVPMLAAQAADSQRQEQGAYNQQLGGLNSDLRANLSSKGQQYVANYQNALSNQATQSQNAQALATANALLPYQLQSAKAQAAADTANASAAPGLNSAKLAQIQANTTAAMARAKAAIASSTGKGSNKNLLAGSSGRQKLVTMLTNSIQTTDPATGTAKYMAAPQASKALFNAAVLQGLMAPSGKELVPGFASVLKEILSSTYPNYKWPWK